VILVQFPPMGVYETLFRFADATGKYLGDPGTHPWAQGYPLTRQIPGGPPLPATVTLGPADLRYPAATGQPELRRAIALHYRAAYGARIDEENVAVFPGGRAAILAVVALLAPKVSVAIEETEYTPYWDLLRLLGRDPVIVPSRPENRFRPGNADRAVEPHAGDDRVFFIRSNPCNPTGVTVAGEELRELVALSSAPGRGALIDEAYEFFRSPEPESALRHIDDIDRTDIFVIGAATKGLQVPGLRVGWVVASRAHIELFRNWSSIAVGGVSRASQLYVTELLEPGRVRRASSAIAAFYGSQRERYGAALERLGFELATGDGGFYHWAKLPEGLTADELNERLFRDGAAILPGRLCDMGRRPAGEGPCDRYIRFSFGAIAPESYDRDIEILARAVGTPSRTGAGAERSSG